MTRAFAMLLIVLFAAAVMLPGCGPSPGTAKGAGATAGMCPSCGGTAFDTHTETERSLETGEEVEYVVLTCRGCGYTSRAPANAR